MGKEKRQLNDVAAIELSLGVVVVEASDLLQAKIHGKAEFERTAKYTPVGRSKLQVSGATLDDIRAKDAVSL